MKYFTIIVTVISLFLLSSCQPSQQNHEVKGGAVDNSDDIKNDDEKEVVDVIGFVDSFKLDEHGYLKEIFLEENQKELGLNPTTEKTMIISFQEKIKIDISIGTKVKVTILNMVRDSGPQLATGISAEVIE
ncbi:hypothetical protein ACFSCX_17640 [Bacillus salitolerans]|uniref:DUF3221 domain-containing protein n=1 Tax=Bacillus salitolerans TaxID=1437434 RepID=A0ABW4LT63_9BACI